MSDQTLGQLAEQAATEMVELASADVDSDTFERGTMRRVRAALDAATQALREQQAIVCSNGECPGFQVGYQAADVDRCDIRILERAEQAEQQLAQVMQERDALLAQFRSTGHVPYLDRMKELSDKRDTAMVEYHQQRRRAEAAEAALAAQRVAMVDPNLQSTTAWQCGCGSWSGVNLAVCGRCCRPRSESEIPA
jgi:hypothetical protein